MPISKEEKETPKTKKELEAIMKKEHIAFCREYVLNGKNGAKAYTKAYGELGNPDSAKVLASGLLTNINIKAYKGLLQEQVAEKYEITLETQLKKTAELTELSKGKEDYRTALACVQEESKLVDLYEPEKKEITVTGEGMDLAQKAISEYLANSK